VPSTYLRNQNSTSPKTTLRRLNSPKTVAELCIQAMYHVAVFVALRVRHHMAKSKCQIRLSYPRPLGSASKSPLVTRSSEADTGTVTVRGRDGAYSTCTSQIWVWQICRYFCNVAAITASEWEVERLLRTG
jgi:hypothetical protein